MTGWKSRSMLGTVTEAHRLRRAARSRRRALRSETAGIVGAISLPHPFDRDALISNIAELRTSSALRRSDYALA